MVLMVHSKLETELLSDSDPTYVYRERKTNHHLSDICSFVHCGIFITAKIQKPPPSLSTGECIKDMYT